MNFTKYLVFCSGWYKNGVNKYFEKQQQLKNVY